jgi:hypothetical protein
MKERIIHPEKPEDIIKELTNPNYEEIDAFSSNFPHEIYQFGESFSKVYKKFLELWRFTDYKDKKEEGVSQKDYVTFLTYLILDNLFTSTKLILLGFQTASGNLMRQVVEGIAVVILCSLQENIKIDTEGNVIERQYFKSLLGKKYYTEPQKAISTLELNKENINITEYGLKLLGLVKNYYSLYSHPTVWSTRSYISNGKPGKLYIGGGFDDGKIQEYKNELKSRVALCDKLPKLIDGLIKKVKKLP